MPLAAMTGVALGAATDISSILMNLNWGYPTKGMEESKLDGHETIDGADCYKIVNATERATKTYWVDSKTFLLRQYKNEVDEEQLARLKPEMDKAMEKARQKSPLPDMKMPDMKMQSMVQLYVFTVQSLNEPLDKTLFQNPT